MHRSLMPYQVGLFSVQFINNSLHMKKLLVLIPDYGIPHHVLQWAIQLTKKDPCYIQGLFIGNAYTADTEGYGFPSDIHSTDRQYSNIETKLEEQNLLETQIKL